jgi:hypothetical protein
VRSALLGGRGEGGGGGGDLGLNELISQFMVRIW